MTGIITEYPSFFTATCLEWKKLLQYDKYKDIIIKSLQFLVQNKRVIIYGFVIMPNHIHLIWQMKAGMKRENVQRDFLKFTAQRIKSDLKKFQPEDLNSYLVNASDRKYQFWERNPLSIEIWTEKFLLQKLNYLHQNPVKKGLCKYPEDYKYSSAEFYETGKSRWKFLTHFLG